MLKILFFRSTNLHFSKRESNCPIQHLLLWHAYDIYSYCELVFTLIILNSSRSFTQPTCNIKINVTVLAIDIFKFYFEEKNGKFLSIFHFFWFKIAHNNIYMINLTISVLLYILHSHTVYHYYTFSPSTLNLLISTQLWILITYSTILQLLYSYILLYLLILSNINSIWAHFLSILTSTPFPNKKMTTRTIFFLIDTTMMWFIYSTCLYYLYRYYQHSKLLLLS